MDFQLLKELAVLHEEGVLTDAEFADAKQRILSSGRANDTTAADAPAASGSPTSMARGLSGAVGAAFDLFAGDEGEDEEDAA